MHCDRRDASRAAWIAGKSKATRIPMIAMTTNTSTRVNARFVCIFFPIKETFENCFELRQELFWELRRVELYDFSEHQLKLNDNVDERPRLSRAIRPILAIRHRQPH